MHFLDVLPVCGFVGVKSFPSGHPGLDIGWETTQHAIPSGLIVAYKHNVAKLTRQLACFMRKQFLRQKY